MKELFTLIKIVAAIIIISFGVNNLNEPSNVDVAIGLAEITIGLCLVFGPIISLFKKL